VPIARLAAAQAALAEPLQKAKPKPKSAAARGKSEDRHRRVLIAAGRRATPLRVSEGRNHGALRRPGVIGPRDAARPGAAAAKPKRAAKSAKKAAKPAAKRTPPKKGPGKPKRGGKKKR